jgi:acyl-CoA thioester hydrolase
MDNFSHPFQVTWSHMDANGHVGNVHYNALATDARVALLLAAGYSFNASQTIGPVVLNDTIHYRKELRYGDKGKVTILLAGSSVDHAKFKIRHEIFRTGQEGDELCCVVDTFGGWMDLKERKLVCPQADYASRFVELPKTLDYEVLSPFKPKR